MIFFFDDTATTEIYTLSLHDALPISPGPSRPASRGPRRCRGTRAGRPRRGRAPCASRCTPRAGSTRSTRPRSEEHTSELQSRQYLVCRLLLEKKRMFFLYLFLNMTYC